MFCDLCLLEYKESKLHVRLNITGSNASEKAQTAIFEGVTTKHISGAHIAMVDQLTNGYDNSTTFFTDLNADELAQSLGKPFNGAVKLTVNDSPENIKVKEYSKPIDTEITLEFEP